MSALFVFSLLLGIFALTTGAAEEEFLTCYSCDNSTIDACDAYTTTCKASKTTGGCVTSVEEASLGDGDPVAFYSKRCVNHTEEVSLGFQSITFGTGKYYRLNVTLCSTDKCNNKTYAVQGNTTSNGKECLTCFDVTGFPCKGVMTPCTGPELMCINASGLEFKPVKKPGSFATQGCATNSVNNSELIVVGQQATYEFKTLESYTEPVIPGLTTPTKQPTAKPATKSSQTTFTTHGGSINQVPTSISIALCFLVFLRCCW